METINLPKNTLVTVSRDTAGNLARNSGHTSDPMPVSKADFSNDGRTMDVTVRLADHAATEDALGVKLASSTVYLSKGRPTVTLAREWE